MYLYKVGIPVKFYKNRILNFIILQYYGSIKSIYVFLAIIKKSTLKLLL